MTVTNSFGIGRACALAVAGGRDLARTAARYDGLFPATSFDAGLYGSLALAGAFGSPWAAGAADLRAVNRASLLVFAVDHLIDEAATTRDEVTTLIGACLAAASGTAPEKPGANGTAPDQTAAAFLGDLRAELAGAPAFPALEHAWRDRLERMLAAMAREWDWSRSANPPAREEYLANADSCGAYFIGVSHWIATGVVDTPEDLDRLRPAGEAVQRCLRLLNDLATRRREARSGDVNAFTIGMTPGEVRERADELAREAAAMIEPLREPYPRAAEYLDWQIHYSAGFYGLADFWAPES